MNGQAKSPSEGELEAFNRLLETFLPKLIRKCENRIGSRYKRKFDGNDIAATVCRTVFRRFKEGKFRLGEDAELWRLMTTISVRKISNKVRAENTLGRKIDREIYSDPDLQLTLSREPSPEACAVFEDLIEKLSQRLDSQMIEILNRKLAGETNQEIAAEIDRVDRTIKRKLDVIENILRDLIPDLDGKKKDKPKGE